MGIFHDFDNLYEQITVNTPGENEFNKDKIEICFIDIL